MRAKLKQINTNVARWCWNLESESLCEEAQRNTGLRDFGDPPLQPGLSILLESLDSEARLHPLGRMLLRMHIKDLLETRLRLVDVWKSKAERQAVVNIEKPVFIVGVPRSGSTFLHELLAEHPEHRAPRVWEVMFPVASREGSRRDQEKRMRKAATCLWFFRKLAPRADAVYPMRANTPHECVAIHSYTLLSEEFVSTCNVPAYEAFLRSTDLTPAYVWQKRFLQHLQLQCPGKRWVMKSPDHVYGLESLFAIFPDAVIIQTHRNPIEVLKSSADLTRVLRRLYGEAGEPEEIRLREARLLAEGAERFIHFRDSHPEFASRIIDVKYTDLVAEPVATFRQICEAIETPMTNVVKERVQRLIASRSRYHGPRASAKTDSLGLDTALGARFERYCTRFGLPFRKADLCE
jgi:hypothetical protein